MLVLIVTSFNLNAQNKWDKDVKTYTNGVFLQGLIDLDSGKITALNPKGKNVTIIYDPFFRTYKINWKEIDSDFQMNLVPKKKLQKTEPYLWTLMTIVKMVNIT